MQKILDIAKAEIGYVETPTNSNKTKFGQFFGLDGVAWCGMFVSWVYYQAGFPLGNIGFKKGFAGCQTAVAHFLKTGEIVPFALAQPGDVVFFDWNGDGRFDHTGILLKKLEGESFETIEGNTSATNQSNGGQVQHRTRTNSKNIIFVHPKILNYGQSV
jgi:cell wall-associated NlpC family hydrolase